MVTWKDIIILILTLTSGLAAIVQLVKNVNDGEGHYIFYGCFVLISFALAAIPITRIANNYITEHSTNLAESTPSAAVEEYVESPTPESIKAYYNLEDNNITNVEHINMDSLTKGSVTCSDYLIGITYKVHYYHYYILDNDLTTAWIEGDTSGSGENEWVQINFDDTYLVDGIKIYNGYHKRLDLLHRNNRIKDIEIVFSDGTSIEITLPDSTFEQYDIIDFGTSIETEYVRLIIKTVYPSDYSGKECWDDTCISEVILY